MARFDARLSKLEATVGQADENRHWQAMLALQPKLREMGYPLKAGHSVT